jgi:N-methylhydantoinase A
MGGTSFDICVIRGGRIPTTREAWVGEERVATKMVDVSAIGAGGGSIAWIDGLGLLRVGPQSAGADPGPAAYGRSELPTVTDADLLLGYLPADYFLGGQLTLDLDRSFGAIESVAQPLGLSTEAGAEAIFDTINGVMADAVTEACTKKGLDIRGFLMVAGGGAGGVHGAEIARRLGIPAVLCPATAPVLSAMGMLTMEIGRELTRAGVWDRLSVTADQINAVFTQLEEEQRAAFRRIGIDAHQIRYRRSLAMRYMGQFHEITIDLREDDLDEAARAALETRFHARYEELYGYSLPWRGVEILECHLRGGVEQPATGGQPPASTQKGSLSAARKDDRGCLINGERREVPVFARELLGAGQTFDGPALVDSSTSTVYVPEAFNAEVDAAGGLILTQSATDVSSPAAAQSSEVAA